MPKPGKAADSHRKKHVVEMSGPSEPPFVPYRNTAKLVGPHTIDLLDLGILRTWLWTDKGKLVDFVLKHELEEEEGDFRDIVKVDCCDQEVHIHRYNADGDEVSRTQIRPIATQEDLNLGYEEARELVFDKWAENHGRWKRGR